MTTTCDGGFFEGRIKIQIGPAENKCGLCFVANLIGNLNLIFKACFSRSSLIIRILLISEFVHVPMCALFWQKGRERERRRERENGGPTTKGKAIWQAHIIQMPTTTTLQASF